MFDDIMKTLDNIINVSKLGKQNPDSCRPTEFFGNG